MTRSDMPSDMRIYGITNRIFKIWKSDKYLDEDKMVDVIKKFQEIKLVLNYDLKKKTNNATFQNNIVSLDWQSPSTFMVVKGLEEFNEWLVNPTEISVDRLSFLDEKNFLGLVADKRRRKIRQRKISIGNFTISETVKVPQVLLKIFSDKPTFLNFVQFLNTLKFKVTNSVKEIIEYVLNLPNFEMNLNKLFNKFKERDKLTEKDILLNKLTTNEEFETLRLNSIRKKEQEKPLKISKKYNDIIREISKNFKEKRIRKEEKTEGKVKES